MPKKLLWTEEGDTLLVQLRQAGTTWDAIAGALGVSRNAALARGKALGAPAEPVRAVAAAPLAAEEEDEAERAPLPAGHPLSWGLINRGTCLEGSPYPLPVFYPAASQRRGA